MNASTVNFNLGGRQVTLETGKIARQAAGAVMVTAGNTKVLATVTVDKNPGDFNFTPLTVHYQERFYATGRIPGSFFRREGRPSEKETLTSRLIDRPLRPLFPKGYRHETLVMCTVMSAEQGVDPDTLAMIGASAALAVSGIPFNGPVSAVRVGLDKTHSGYTLNPTAAELESSVLDMVVAGSADAVLMVESEARELTEDVMLGAVLFAHQQMQPAIEAIAELARQVGARPLQWEAPVINEALTEGLEQKFGSQIDKLQGIADKAERQEQMAEILAEATEQFSDNTPEEISDCLGKLASSAMRSRLLSGQPRLDGRDLTTVRDISCEIGSLPQTHGSAMFTRGSTQALGIVTLGTKRDAQLVDALDGKDNDQFLLHYNFPPYCVGESGRVGPPGRREIGHGRLAKRALAAVMPDLEEFPYTIRLVSEITESNGSSSMATVCVCSLAMMDAGVPVSRPVAGIAMGLIKEGSEFRILTDILGDEDHLGDMDFKVAGTDQGITALQMDIKISGITEEIMEQALRQAGEARRHILSEMNDIIATPRSEIAAHAPGFKQLSIPVTKIRDLIGKGGETIRLLTAETGTDIDVEQDGTVRIYGETRSGLDEAVERIKGLTAVAELGKIYTGKVVRIVDFGAFVNFLPGKDGLVHISQIAQKRIRQVSDYLSEGQETPVKVIGIDEAGKVSLSIKEAKAEDEVASGDEK